MEENRRHHINEEMLEQLKKQTGIRILQTVFIAAIFLCVAWMTYRVTVLAPQVTEMVEEMDTLAKEMNGLVTEVDTLINDTSEIVAESDQILDSMNEVMPELIQSVKDLNTVVTYINEEGLQKIAGTLETINKLDMGSLNDAIGKLQTTVEPMARLFGKFND